MNLKNAFLWTVLLNIGDGILGAPTVHEHPVKSIIGALLLIERERAEEQRRERTRKSRRAEKRKKGKEQKEQRRERKRKRRRAEKPT